MSELRVKALEFSEPQGQTEAAVPYLLFNDVIEWCQTIILCPSYMRSFCVTLRTARLVHPVYACRSLYTSMFLHL